MRIRGSFLNIAATTLMLLQGLSGCPSARAAEGTQGVFFGFLETLYRDRRAAFVSQCEIASDTKAVIVFPINGVQGRYAILQKDRQGTGRILALALGAAKVKHGDWYVDGTTGGLASGPAQAAMIRELMRGPFIFVKAERLGETVRNFNIRDCEKSN